MTITTMKLSLATLFLVSFFGTAAAVAKNDAPDEFKVALWGDLPYRGAEVNVFDGEYGPMYKKLQEGINGAGVEFAVHTGDVKAGGASCGASTYKRFLDLAEFGVPSLLTLGDNGWTDCHRLSNGNYDPLERLDWMRNAYFSPEGGNVMGGGSILTDAQDGYVENQMFAYGSSMWALVHVVGSNNALYDDVERSCDPYLAVIDPNCEAATAEYEARDAAVNEYVSKAFADARMEGSEVVFIVIQANIFSGPCGTSDPETQPEACIENRWGCGCCDITQPVYIGTGFVNFWENLVAESNNFDGPVYLIHGDSHYYQIFPNPTGDAENLVAVQVPGSTDIGWVETTIAGSDVSFVMVDNNPDFDYYDECPDSPSLEALELVEDFAPACESIAAIACGTEGFETLCMAVQAAGLEETLSGDGMFTVFAPTNDAFAAIPSAALEGLLADPTGELADTLLYHVVAGQKLMSTDLPCQAGENTLEMANGKDTRTLCVGGIPTLQKGIANSQDASPGFVGVDVEACNGVVHIIDGVLLDNSFL